MGLEKRSTIHTIRISGLPKQNQETYEQTMKAFKRFQTILRIYFEPAS